MSEKMSLSVTASSHRPGRRESVVISHQKNLPLIQFFRTCQSRWRSSEMLSIWIRKRNEIDRRPRRRRK